MENYLIQLGGKKNGYFRRSAFIKKSDQRSYDNFVRRHDNTDVYYSIYSYADENADDCMLYGPAYFDLDAEIDSEDCFKKIKKDTLLVMAFLQHNLGIPEKHIELYFSGAKGFHILVQPEVFGAEPLQHLNVIYKAIAMIANKNTITGPIDPGIYDRKRLFRIPNSINGKTGLYKIPLSAQKLRRSSLESLQKFAQEPRKFYRPKPQLVAEARNRYHELLSLLQTAGKKRKQPLKSGEKTTYERMLPCVEYILENGVCHGERNEASVALASALFQSGKSHEEVMEIMEDWDTRNDPPLGEEDPDEVRRTVESAEKMFESERGYGCSHFKGIGYCVKGCPIDRRNKT